MTQASSFPHLSPAEFALACRLFARSYRSPLEAKGLSLRVVEGDASSSYVEITRPVHQAAASPVSSQVIRDDLLPDMADDEDEALVLPHANVGDASVEYDVLYSPSYQVPALYFRFRGLEASAQPPTDRMRDLLVPEIYRSQVDGFGFSGAISFAEHPIRGSPAYFVHPCNTADAMAELAQGNGVDIEHYIQVWLGLVGHCAGLSLPAIQPRSV